jgi:hypothetical protein
MASKIIILVGISKWAEQRSPTIKSRIIHFITLSNPLKHCMSKEEGLCSVINVVRSRVQTINVA